MNTCLHATPAFSHLICAGMGLAAFAASPARAAVTVNFNDTGDLAANFNKGTTTGSGTGSLTNPATGGLGNSGSLSIPTGVGNDSFLYTTKSGISATTSIINVSVYFQAQAATLTGGALALSIGLVDSTPATTTTPVGIPDSASSNSFTLTLRNAGSGTSSGLNYNLVSYNNTSVTTAATGSTPGNVNLTAGNWYQLAATYTYLGSNNYSLTGQIFNSDSDGVLGSAIFTTAPVWNATNAGLADGDAYGLLSSQNGNRRGLGQMDNYSLVPEPSSALLLGAGMGLMVLRRNRRSVV